MFGLGFWECIIIVVGVILFIKPEDLPVFIRGIGKAYGTLTHIYKQFLREMNTLDKG